jgi:hypothetical protein
VLGYCQQKLDSCPCQHASFLHWNFDVNTRPFYRVDGFRSGFVLGCFFGFGFVSFAGLGWETAGKALFRFTVLEYSKSYAANEGGDFAYPYQ